MMTFETATDVVEYMLDTLKPSFGWTERKTARFAENLLDLDPTRAMLVAQRLAQTSESGDVPSIAEFRALVLNPDAGPSPAAEAWGQVLDVVQGGGSYARPGAAFDAVTWQTINALAGSWQGLCESLLETEIPLWAVRFQRFYDSFASVRRRDELSSGGVLEAFESLRQPTEPHQGELNP